MGALVGPLNKKNALHVNIVDWGSSIDVKIEELYKTQNTVKFLHRAPRDNIDDEAECIMELKMHREKAEYKFNVLIFALLFFYTRV